MIYTTFALVLIVGAVIGGVIVICVAQHMEEKSHQKKLFLAQFAYTYALDHNIAYEEALKITKRDLLY